MIKLKPKLNRRLKNLSWLHYTAAVAVLIILAGATYALVHNPKPTPASDISTTQSTKNNGPKVNLNPGTPQEKQSTEDAKKNPTPTTPAPTTPSGKQQIYPVITSVTSTEVDAYVSGIGEDGGICTATATKSSQTPRTATSTGFANASTTNCMPIPLALPSTGWSVVVTYSSASYEGTSQAYAY